jgi:hypothetical protein
VPPLDKLQPVEVKVEQKYHQFLDLHDFTDYGDYIPFQLFEVEIRLNDLLNSFMVRRNSPSLTPFGCLEDRLEYRRQS